MLIAQLSDLHIAPGEQKTFGVAPMAENLQRCVAHINALKPTPDLVLVTGDIANDAAQAEVERAAAILGRLDSPFYLVPGNHDNRRVLSSVFGNQVCPTSVDGFIQYEIDGYDLRLIGLDSVSHASPGGELCPKRLAWLEERLTQADERPCVIFMHHPPANFAVPETDIDGFLGAEDFGDLVEKYGKIERILAGHIHLPAFRTWRQTIISTAPSIGMRLTIDLTLEKDSQFILEEPSYHLHYWTPEGTLLTHQIIVADEKAYSFAYEPAQ